METFLNLIRAFGAFHDLCVQVSNMFIEPIDRCTLPIHFAMLLLEQWPF